MSVMNYMRKMKASIIKWIDKNSKKLKVAILVVFVVCLICYIRNVISIIMMSKSEPVINEVARICSKDEVRERLMSKRDKIVVIDAGHGGNDPGKVGVHNELEKDINLSIAYILKDKLIKSGFSVIMTRTGDDGLYDVNDTNKKVSDMKKRVEIINLAEAICMVSIHQNSYTSSSEHGAQSFYYSTSDISKELAIFIQESMKKNYDANNKRMEKSNDSYFILKKSFIPAVIVECGFLSNEEEANKLTTPKCQYKVAEAIKLGIIKWANDIIAENCKIGGN